MGLRGPAPQPTQIRILNGNPSRRPLPGNEPYYPPGITERPAMMSPAARRIWDRFVEEMECANVLRSVDAMALSQLCEDEALLGTLRRGVAQMAAEVAREAKAKKRKLPGGPMVALAQTTEGRRTFTTMRELASQIIVQRREFGLTPSARTRVQALGPNRSVDSIEDGLCGRIPA